MYNIPNYNTNFYTAPQQPTLKGRPVSSFEEVKAASVDFDGTIFYFPDLANRKIYTKQIGLDGIAVLNVYELKEMPIETNINNSDFITREEFEKAIASLQLIFQEEKNKKPEVQSILNQF